MTSALKLTLLTVITTFAAGSAQAAEVCSIVKNNCGQVAVNCTRVSDSRADIAGCKSVIGTNKRMVQLMKELLEKGYTPFGDGLKFRK